MRAADYTRSLIGFSLMLLAGCTVSHPGNFSQVDEAVQSSASEFRYRPEKLNHQSLMTFLQQQCHKKGFNHVDALPEQPSAIPGHKIRWFQCSYALKTQ